MFHVKVGWEWWTEYVQGGAPSSYKLVVNPLTIDISPINHSFWSYKPT